MLRATAGFRILQPGAQALRLFPGLRLAGGKADPEHQDIQDPNVTGSTPYRAEPKHVPTEEELGSEREVKWGVNIPASGEQLKEELEFAGKGLAESVAAGAAAMVNKGKDAVESARRSMGMESSRPDMSLEDMGAAGKMEYAPPGATGGGPQCNARAKYDEIKASKEAHFPEGERSVTEQWRRAGSYQNSPEAASKLAATPESQHDANVEIRREMEAQRAGSGGSAADMDESRDTGSGLAENLHKRGP